MAFMENEGASLHVEDDVPCSCGVFDRVSLAPVVHCRPSKGLEITGLRYWEQHVHWDGVGPYFKYGTRMTILGPSFRNQELNSLDFSCQFNKRGRSSWQIFFLELLFG